MRPELVNRRPREITRRDFLRTAGIVFAGVGMNLLVNPQEADAKKGKGHNKERKPTNHNQDSKPSRDRHEDKNHTPNPHHENNKPGDKDPEVCAQVETTIINPDTGQTRVIPNRCDIPKGWVIVFSRTN